MPQHGGSVKRTYKRGRIPFDSSINLPEYWDCSTSTVNLDDELLVACGRRILQQRTFDKKPLGIGVCYGCGHVLWSSVDYTHTYLIDVPQDKTIHDAPAAAYLNAVPNCSLNFVYPERANLLKQRWYSCAYCKSGLVPPDQHVGDIFDATKSATKPVKD